MMSKPSHRGVSLSKLPPGFRPAKAPRVRAQVTADSLALAGGAETVETPEVGFRAASLSPMWCKAFHHAGPKPGGSLERLTPH